MGMNVTDQVVTIEAARRTPSTSPQWASSCSCRCSCASAGLVIGFFNAVLGGEASFKQGYAIVVHSGVIGALQTLFVTPLNYATESDDELHEPRRVPADGGRHEIFRHGARLDRPVPDLVHAEPRDRSRGAYTRSGPRPMAWSLLAIYGIIVLIIAGVRAALSGA